MTPLGSCAFLYAMTKHIFIPPSEYSISYTRSSGPGGQNINKVASRAQLRWSLTTSTILGDEQKIRVANNLRHKLSINQEIIISVEDTRSQSQNKLLAVERLQTLITQALIIPKRRRITKPTRSSQEKRLETKKKHSTIKKGRQFDHNTHNT